jgi:hypothetical protein
MNTSVDSLLRLDVSWLLFGPNVSPLPKGVLVIAVNHIVYRFEKVLKDTPILKGLSGSTGERCIFIFCRKKNIFLESSVTTVG